MICKYLEIIFNIHKIGEDELIMKRFNRNTGITLIALVITIALNCLRSGRKLECVA